ncbi:hypothetical protein NQ315_014531 [Exocentrus adspersus]|uniref:THAP-type domain-containing protein n=1 Tax=Exocentrus adspersus TaxID=1586481 RepID=A0AAV8VKY7_9CUCU|nr:hypothetical protein NQ315_014531 [Exocentrus adspersus]
MRCAVCRCNSDNQSKKNPYSDIKFFHFPKDETLCKKWLLATKREDKFNLKTACICSKHFQDTDYKLNLQHELLNYKPKRYRGLKDDAVPSLNLPSRTNIKKNSNGHCSGIQKRDRKRVVADLLSAVQTIMTGTDINRVEESLASRNQEIVALKQKLSALEKVFSKNQLKKLQSNKRIQWSVSEVSNGIVLHSAGPRAYRLMLKKGYPYPAVATLRAWLRKIKIQPGILRNVFKLIDSSDFNKPDRKIQLCKCPGIGATEIILDCSI